MNVRQESESLTETISRQPETRSLLCYSQHGLRAFSLSLSLFRRAFVTAAAAADEHMLALFAAL